MTSNINLLDTSHQDNIQLTEPENEVDNNIDDLEEVTVENEANNNIVDLKEKQPATEIDKNIVDLEEIQPENKVDNDILDSEDIQNKSLLPLEFPMDSDKIQKNAVSFVRYLLFCNSHFNANVFCC